MTAFVTAGIVMGVLGIALSAILALANSRFYVYEDPRIDKVEDLLPGANCGACGQAGCRAFAEACVGDVAAPGGCTVSDAEGIKSIAKLLGVAAGAQIKRVARLACAGGSHVAKQRAQYEGLEGCRAANLVSGGGKGCVWGCLGLGDCARVCDFDAITMDEHGLPVVDENLCTACGDCVDICPKGLFSIHQQDHRLWIACKNIAEGDEAEAECEVACTACGRCVMDAPANAIRLENNLAVIDYTKNKRLDKTPMERCPTGAIIWYEKNKGPVKGKAAKKITRKSSLPVGVD